MTLRKLTLAIFAALLVLPEDISAASFRWPWEVQYHRKKHRKHYHRSHREKLPPPNCARIKEAVEALEPERLKETLAHLPKSQQATIRRCLDR